MDSFKTVAPAGVRVSGGDRVGVPALARSRRRRRNRERHRRSAARAVAERGAVVRGLERADREPADQPAELHQPDRLRARVKSSPGGSTGFERLGGVSQNNLMMDGISAMDTGNNGTMLAMNIESIGEVKILTQGYQAEYGRSSGLQVTAVTKSGTNRFRGSVYDVERDSTGTRTAGSTSRTATRSRSTTRTTGATRSAVRSASRAATTSCSSSTATSTARGTRRSTTATRSGCGCRPRLERNGDFSQSLDNNGAFIR